MTSICLISMSFKYTIFSLFLPSETSSQLSKLQNACGTPAQGIYLHFRVRFQEENVLLLLMLVIRKRKYFPGNSLLEGVSTCNSIDGLFGVHPSTLALPSTQPAKVFFFPTCRLNNKFIYPPLTVTNVVFTVV